MDDDDDDLQDFLLETRQTVGVFGDPHLLAYGTDEIVTCTSPGWQVYLNNEVIRIRGRNVQIRNESSATALEEVEKTS